LKFEQIHSFVNLAENTAKCEWKYRVINW